MENILANHDDTQSLKLRFYKLDFEIFKRDFAEHNRMFRF